MTFLNSVFLAALAAVVLPLLIHFLSRRRIKIIDFSSLKFLMTMQKSKLRWLKILELLLLLIRMTIIALIALAFARPALTGKHAASHAPASIAILVDDSPSLELLSSGGTIFDDQKRGIGEIIALLKPGDDVTIITLSGKATVNGRYSDFNRAKEAVNSLVIQPAPPDFREGLRLAGDNLSQSHNLNREIYIFSDFQNTSAFSGNYTDLINNDYRYFAIKYANTNAENIGIAKVSFPAQLLAPNEEFELKAEIKNYSDKTQSGRLLEIYLDGSKRAQTTIDIKPNASVETGFTIVPDQPGSHYGYFELEDDDYSYDNKFYFNFDIPKTIKVLGVADNPDDARFMFNILGRTETGYIDFSGVTAGGLSSRNLNEFDVIILDDISALTLGNFNSLTDFVNSGKGLFIILGKNSNLDSYKSFLAESAALNVSPKITSSPESDQNAYFNLSNYDFSHPIFKIYNSSGSDTPEIPPVAVYGYYPINGGSSLAKIGVDKTALAMSAKAKIIVSGFGLDLACSDISLHSFVVPFMIRTVEYLASKPSAAQEYYISGQPATLNLPSNISSSSAKLIYAADKIPDPSKAGSYESSMIEIGRGAFGAFVNIPHVDYPGFYAIAADSVIASVFSVNHDSSESIAATFDESDIQDRLSKDIIFIESQKNISEAVMQAKYGVELWKYFLAAALLLLIVESILVRKAR